MFEHEKSDVNEIVTEMNSLKFYLSHTYILSAVQMRGCHTKENVKRGRNNLKLGYVCLDFCMSKCSPCPTSRYEARMNLKDSDVLMQ